MPKVLGADVLALHRLAGQLRDDADKVSDIRTLAARAVGELQASWGGHDLIQLLALWDQQVSPSLGHASSLLTACGAELSRQGAEQKHTSQSSAGPAFSTAGTGLVLSPTGSGEPLTEATEDGIPPGLQSELLALAEAMPFGTGPPGAALRVEVRAMFDSMTSGQATALALANPGLVGNLSGAPFAVREHANRAQVQSALKTERLRLLNLEEDSKKAKENAVMGWSSRRDDLRGSIASSRAKVRLYQSIIDNHRAILGFDPLGDGALVERHGDITRQTHNVGVFIPGTSSEMSSYESASRTSQGFVNNSSGLTMITWMGGDFPDSILSASFVGHSQDLGPKAASFSHDLRQELDGSAARNNLPQITFAGHSYGGAVVGLAEAAGLDADRVLQIESAGMGHGVDSPADLHNANPNVRRYSITAEQDAIQLSRGRGYGDDMNHGANPDTFQGATRLDAGNFENGKLIARLRSHSDVLAVRSDAWWNMQRVFTGGEATAYRDPEFATGPHGEMRQVPYAKPARKVEVP